MPPSRQCAVLIAAVLLAPTIAAADCAIVGLTPQVLTPASTTLPTDGGIVIAATPTPRAPMAAGDVAVQPAWRMRVRKARLVPKIEVLAPGLAVYRAAGSALTLEDSSHKVIATVAVTTDVKAPLAAPKLKQLAYSPLKTRHGTEMITAVLDGDAPAGAIAMVLAEPKTNKPLTWGLVTNGTVTPYKRGDCETLANGTAPPAVGATVVAFWVDAAGRRSPASAPVRIQ